MPIRTRITGEAERAELKRKAKGRHPLLKNGSKHQAVWQAICQDGNPKGGITAARLRALLGPIFHPQVLKDLIDHRLVTQRDKRPDGSFRYIGDDRGIGTYCQTVTVEVELLEDDKGRFVTKTTLVGSTGKHSRIIRSLGRRRINFNVPLPNEPGVEKIVGVVNVDNAQGFNSTPGMGRTAKFVEGESQQRQETGLIEGSYTILGD